MTNDNPYTYALTADPCKPMREAQELIKRLTAERDEARRMICRLHFTSAELQHDFAKAKGWDCFKQEDEPCSVTPAP